MSKSAAIKEMIKQAIVELGGNATHAQLRDAVLARYPGVNANTVSGQIYVCTVNAPSRVSYPENSRPRVADDPRYDFLYSVGRGQLELYDPARHGVWEIVKGEDRRLHVAQTSTALEEDDEHEETARAEVVVSLERHLRDFLADNLGSLGIAGGPFRVFRDKAGQSGVEYRTDVGTIDILAVDRGGNFVVFELKLGRGPDTTVGQLARYLGWVRRNLAGERAVRGVIVARTVDEKLRYAASEIPNVSLFEYSMSFSLRPADAVGEA